MMILLVVGIGVAIFLLWRILNVQVVRAQISVARTQIEATHLANTIAKDVAASFTAQAGTEEQAKKEGRLIEFLQKAAAMPGMDNDAVREFLSVQPQTRKDLITESLVRGVRCEYLDHSDFVELHNGYPGPEPCGEPYCTEHCDVEWLPSDSETCPFCGAPTKIDSPDEEIGGEESDMTTWRRDMDKWERYRKLYPEQAAKREAESKAAHTAADEGRRARFRQLFAEDKSERGPAKTGPIS